MVMGLGEDEDEDEIGWKGFGVGGKGVNKEVLRLSSVGEKQRLTLWLFFQLSRPSFCPD